MRDARKDYNAGNVGEPGTTNFRPYLGNTLPGPNDLNLDLAEHTQHMYSNN